MIVQRDFLMRQIEQLSAALARWATGQPAEDDAHTLDQSEADVTRVAGLGVDIAERVPAETVATLVDGDANKLLALGLALGRRAWRHEDPSRARAALRLLDLAAARGATADDLAAARDGLMSLALG
ncbi:MAG: hypothetical protein R3F65_28125 [bacterium]|nr:hypothetical protein [Myxococcales bacterium]